MKLKDFLECLTRYFIINVACDWTSEEGWSQWEDQTIVPDVYKEKEVEMIDFIEDTGEGQEIVVWLKM